MNKGSGTARSLDHYDKSLTKSFVFEQLKEALQCEDQAAITSAFNECKLLGLDQDPRVRHAVTFDLPIIRAKQKLMGAYSREDIEEIEEQIKDIRRRGLSHNLLVEVKQAKVFVKYLKKRDEQRAIQNRKVLSVELNARTFSEIKRYNNPPRLLHTIIQAALLLLGEDEESTSDWKYCQRICTPYGPSGISRRVMNFDLDEVHEEILARAREITEGIELKQVEAIGAGTGLAFYMWTVSVIQRAEAEKLEEETSGSETNVTPANGKRQKEIFHAQKMLAYEHRGHPADRGQGRLY